MDDNLITIIQDDQESVAEVLFTYEDEETSKQYVVFRIVESDEISAARYVESDEEGGFLEDIETEEEWDMLDDLLDGYFESLEDIESEDEEEEEAV